MTFNCNLELILFDNSFDGFNNALFNDTFNIEKEYNNIEYI